MNERRLGVRFKDMDRGIWEILTGRNMCDLGGMSEKAQDAHGENLGDFAESVVRRQVVIVVRSAHGFSLRSPQRASLCDRIDVWLGGRARMIALSIC